MNNIEWIQNWFKDNCDGDWENIYGIEIGTLDNPGWYIKIELTETKFSGISMDEVIYDIADDDWYRCIVEKNTFKGYGDVDKLDKLIEVFKHWIESNV